jgi:hypothetical protein
VLLKSNSTRNYEPFIFDSVLSFLRYWCANIPYLFNKTSNQMHNQSAKAVEGGFWWWAQQCLKHVEWCLRGKAINIRLIVHLVGCFIEYFKMHGTTNPKYCICVWKVKVQTFTWIMFYWLKILVISLFPQENTVPSNRHQQLSFHILTYSPFVIKFHYLLRLFNFCSSDSVVK